MGKENASRPFPLRLGLPSDIKQLRVEHVKVKTQPIPPGYDPVLIRTEDQGYWRLWLMANGDFSLGTCIRLWDNGDVDRITYHEDGTESVMEIKD